MAVIRPVTVFPAPGPEVTSTAAGGAGVAVRHVNRALFVAYEDELHLGLHGLQRVEDRDRGSAGVSEDVFDAEIVEGFDQGLCAVQLLVAHKNWPFRGRSRQINHSMQSKIAKMPPISTISGGDIIRKLAFQTQMSDFATIA
jgi:hypothetical protein